MIIIHLIPNVDWEKIQGEQSLFGESIIQNGFVHCCLPKQIGNVLRQWFAGQNDIIALEIDTNLLTFPFVLENLEGGRELFPHIYGLVNKDAVIRWYPVNNIL